MKRLFSLKILMLGLAAITITGSISRPASAQPGSRPTPTPAPPPNETPTPTKTSAPSARTSRPGTTGTNTVRNRSRPVPSALQQKLIGNWVWLGRPQDVYVFSSDGTGTNLPSKTHCSNFRYQIKGDLLVMTRISYSDCAVDEEGTQTYRITISGDEMKMDYLERDAKKHRDWRWLIRTTGQTEVPIRFHTTGLRSRPPYKVIEVNVETGAHVEVGSRLLEIEETYCCRLKVLAATDPRAGEYEEYSNYVYIESPVSGTVVKKFPVSYHQEIKADELLLIIRKDQ